MHMDPNVMQIREERTGVFHMSNVVCCGFSVGAPTSHYVLLWPFMSRGIVSSGSGSATASAFQCSLGSVEGSHLCSESPPQRLSPLRELQTCVFYLCLIGWNPSFGVKLLWRCMTAALLQCLLGGDDQKWKYSVCETR